MILKEFELQSSPTVVYKQRILSIVGCNTCSTKVVLINSIVQKIVNIFLKMCFFYHDTVIENDMLCRYCEKGSAL